MDTPARNMVEIVDLSPSDALLPILECVSNAIISVSQTNLPVEERRIEVDIIRGEPRQREMFSDLKPIKDVLITDNGVGFNDKNLESFETPHSNILRKEFGCLGVGRFTVLAAFRKMKIRSNFPVNGHWRYREFDFDVIDEVKPRADSTSTRQMSETVVELCGLYHEDLIDKTAVPLQTIAKAIQEHFLIFYLSGTLPAITVREQDSEPLSVYELYKDVSKENERTFTVAEHDFKVYITRNPKTSNRQIIMFTTVPIQESSDVEGDYLTSIPFSTTPS